MPNLIIPIILSGGFGRRTQGVLNELPKLLIQTSDSKCIFDHIIDDLTFQYMDQKIYVVSNSLHYQSIKQYSKKFDSIKICIINNGVTKSENRLGSLGDLRFGISKINTKCSDFLVLPSDYAYWKSFFISQFLVFSKRYPDSFCIIGYDLKDKNLIKKRFGCVEIDSDENVKSFVEKPENPPSTIAGSAFYIYRNRHIKMLNKFLSEGNDGDSPGRFIPYLLKKDEPVKIFLVKNLLIDAGTPEDIERAKKY